MRKSSNKSGAVRTNQGRAAASEMLANQIRHSIRRLAVQALEWLVAQQQRWPVKHCRRKSDLLGSPSRQVRQRAVTMGSQTQRLHQICHTARPFRRPQSSSSRNHLKVLIQSQQTRCIEIGWHVAYSVAPAPDCISDHSPVRDPTTAAVEPSRDSPQKCRLTRTIRACKPYTLTRSDREAGTADECAVCHRYREICSSEYRRVGSHTFFKSSLISETRSFNASPSLRTRSRTAVVSLNVTETEGF